MSSLINKEGQNSDGSPKKSPRKSCMVIRGDKTEKLLSPVTIIDIASFSVSCKKWNTLQLYSEMLHTEKKKGSRTKAKAGV